jgi:hypothetical protein
MKALLLTFFVWLKGDDEKTTIEELPVISYHQKRHRVMAHAKNKLRKLDGDTVVSDY